MGCFLPAFNPDVWPPSNPSRRGTVATGSARGLKTWPTGCRLWHNGLFFTGFQSGRLAALKRFPAGYGCHWLQALAQWAVFYRLSIRTFGRPQTLPGGVRLPLALLGASKLGFSPFPAGSGTMGCVSTFFTCHSGRFAALKPFPAGYGCHWLQALAQWAVFYRLSIRTFGRPQTLPGGVRLPLAAGFGTMGCFLPAFNPDVWPPSNPSRRGTVATGSARGLKTWPTGCRLWHNGLFFTGFQSGRLAALKRFPAGYGFPGGVRLPLALLGASKLGPLAAGFGTMGCFLPAFNPDVWPPSNASRQGTAATGCRLWHNGLFFTGFQSGRLAALKPFPAGYGCHWLC